MWMRHAKHHDSLAPFGYSDIVQVDLARLRLAEIGEGAGPWFPFSAFHRLGDYYNENLTRKTCGLTSDFPSPHFPKTHVISRAIAR